MAVEVLSLLRKVMKASGLKTKRTDCDVKLTIHKIS